MKKNILIAAVMFFALSVAAFAQATFTVGSVPESTVACCGQTERTGDVSFTTVYGSPLSVTGTITVTYPVAITNTAGPTGIQIRVPAGWPIPALPTINSLVPTVNPTQVVIQVPMNIPAGWSFRLTGVRVDVSSQFSGSINATASSTYNLLTAGETGFKVIENIAQPLVYVAPTGVTVNSVTGAITGTSAPKAYFKVREGFLDAFGKTAADEPTQNLAKMIRIKLSTIPAGVTLTFPATVVIPAQDLAPAGMFTRATSAGALAATAVSVTSADNPVVLYYIVSASTNPAGALETFSAEINVSVSSAALPLSGGTITATAHIAPIDTNTPKTLIPRYADAVECETAPATLVTISGGSTTLLIPYAQTADIWDTGVAIANTTKDPGTAMSITGARVQSGTITFYLYKQADGTLLTYTTQAGSPGSGLDAAGKLPSGQLYTVMLSQIVTAAGGPADGSFSGYVFVVANFTNAHGEFFVYDSNPITFVHGALMLVVTSDRSGGMEALNN